jgi:hypothetical protein
MKKTKHFDIFGIYYRTLQFPAAGSLDLMGKPLHPTKALEFTEVKDENGEWHRLDNREAINKYVRDILDMMPPVLVMRGLMRVVNEFSFGFAREWSGIKVPARFQSGTTDHKSSKYIDPIVSQILQEGMASLRELEEYYSLEDAFKMFDVIVGKSVNSALANEAARKR